MATLRALSTHKNILGAIYTLDLQTLSSSDGVKFADKRSKSYESVLFILMVMQYYVILISLYKERECKV